MFCNASGHSKLKFSKVAEDDFETFSKPKGNHQPISSTLRIGAIMRHSWPGFPFPAGLLGALLVEKGAKDPHGCTHRGQKFVPLGPGSLSPLPVIDPSPWPLRRRAQKTAPRPWNMVAAGSFGQHFIIGDLRIRLRAGRFLLSL